MIWRALAVGGGHDTFDEFGAGIAGPVGIFGLF
jgi:hypothetical protein